MKSTHKQSDRTLIFEYLKYTFFSEKGYFLGLTFHAILIGGMDKPKTGKPDKVSLVRLEPVLQIVQCILWTGRISDESPVSACLVAESQSAKSQCLLYYSGTKTIKIYSDVTAKGLMQEIRRIETKELRHILLLDLHMIVSHNRYTADRALLTLGGLMEEGLGTVSDAGGTVNLDTLPKIGVIMAVTPDFYISKQGYWRKTGFLSRFLTIRYTYSDKTKKLIHETIRNGHKLPDPLNLNLPSDCQIVEITPEHGKLIMAQAQLWGANNSDPGYRYHKQLRRLIKASALIDGRHVTNSADVDKVLGFMEFMNPKEPVIL